MSTRSFISIALLLVLGACGARIVPNARPPQSAGVTVKPVPNVPIPPKPVIVSTPGPNAREIGAIAVEMPTPDKASAGRALQAFRISCPSLVRRNDQSGLTRKEDWRPACAAASSWRNEDATGFFATNFEAVQIGDGKSFATGYYEPEIIGSRAKGPGYDVPIYRRPTDLIDVDLGLFSDELKGKKIRGRVKGQSFVPYADRTEIEEGALAGRGLEIAWAADAAEFFFLQVQGSGRLKLPDGSVMRIGYDGQNGRDYTGIGKLMRDRGLLGPGQTSMQGILNWLHDHPDEGRAIMRENKSWVFFKELTGPGPIGALGLPVTGNATVAADPSFVPLGAPVFLSMDRLEATGLWIAQDTGGAIKGSNRFDTFWGAGARARALAGGMAARGTAFVLLPLGTLARIAQEQAIVPPPQP